MKGWQFTDTNAPLVRAELPEPVPGPEHVLLEVVAAGLCHTDVGLMTDPAWKASVPSLPVVPGHEIAGRVLAVGPGVEGIAVGDAFGVCPTVGRGAPGFARNGGFADRYLSHVDELVPVPAGLDLGLAALGTDAGMTAYHALVVEGEVKAGDRVGIIGLGGLGQIGARVAVLRGAEVHVAETNRSVWHLAEQIGAASVVESVAALAAMDLDLVVDYAGVGNTTAQALDAIGMRGRIVVVGLGVWESTISTRKLISKQARLIGSNGGSKQDVADVYALMASGEVQPAVTDIGFDDIPQGLDDLHHGRVTGRLVARIAD